MPLRERTTGPRLRVLLQRYRTTFVGELDDDVDEPTPTIICGVRGSASVMSFESRSQIGGESGDSDRDGSVSLLRT